MVIGIPVYMACNWVWAKDYKWYTGKKLAPVLQKAIPKSSSQRYRVQVTNLSEFKPWLQQKLPQVRIQSQSPTTRTVILAGVTVADVTQLLQNPAVKFIHVPDRVPREELVLEHADLTANKGTALHKKYPQLNGNGLVASVKENPFDTTDIDLKNRIIPTLAINGERAK